MFLNEAILGSRGNIRQEPEAAKQRGCRAPGNIQSGGGGREPKPEPEPLSAKLRAPKTTWYSIWVHSHMVYDNVVNF